MRLNSAQLFPSGGRFPGVAIVFLALLCLAGVEGQAELHLMNGWRASLAPACVPDCHRPHHSDQRQHPKWDFLETRKEGPAFADRLVCVYVCMR